VYCGRGSSVFADRADSALALAPYREQEEGTRLKLGFTSRNGSACLSCSLWAVLALFASKARARPPAGNDSARFD